MLFFSPPNCNSLKSSEILVLRRFCVTNKDLPYSTKTGKYLTFDGSAMNQQLLCFCLKMQMGNIHRPLFLILKAQSCSAIS